MFAELKRQTIDATVRADILFSRDLSLQLYAQPYLTVGDYKNPRELARPQSYDLIPVEGIPDFAAEDVHDYDFRYASVNINAVLRWEYRPGSTFYLVWKQGRGAYEDRGSFEGGGFNPSLRAGDLFDKEPENVLLAKITYWFPI